MTTWATVTSCEPDTVCRTCDQRIEDVVGGMRADGHRVMVTRRLCGHDHVVARFDGVAPSASIARDEVCRGRFHQKFKR